MSDIVERLDEAQRKSDALGLPVAIFKDAKAEIEQLRAQVERLLSGLSSALGYMRNADIDLSTGAPKKTAQATIRGGIKMAEQIMGEHGDSLAITSTNTDRPTCKLCGLEDGACICRSIPPQDGRPSE